jgi:hypothetical protein
MPSAATNSEQHQQQQQQQLQHQPRWRGLWLLLGQRTGLQSRLVLLATSAAACSEYVLHVPVAAVAHHVAGACGCGSVLCVGCGMAEALFVALIMSASEE